eukprot:13169937-Alexandrium_andersonii.AAC.1
MDEGWGKRCTVVPSTCVLPAVTVQVGIAGMFPSSTGPINMCVADCNSAGWHRGLCLVPGCHAVRTRTVAQRRTANTAQHIRKR